MLKLINNQGSAEVKHIIFVHQTGKKRKAGELQGEDSENTQPQVQPGGEEGNTDRAAPETSRCMVTSDPAHASPVHSPFSSSAAKKAARQSSRVMTGPQNQLGVQDTTNL